MPNLIGFDKNRDNVEFKGPCKLSVNFISNYLFVEPKNEEFKLISSSFEWNYVMKKNLLFVCAEFDFLDFCLEFRDEQMCKKILDSIYSVKKNKEMTDTISIDESFIKPIFQKIADNPTLNSTLINVMARWHQLLGEDDKEIYTNLMKEYGIFDTISVAIQNEANQSEQLIFEESKNRKRRFTQIKKEEMVHDEMEKKVRNKSLKQYFQIIPSTQFRLIHIRRLYHHTLLVFISDQMDSFHQFKSNSRTDKFKCVTCEQKAIIDIDEDGEICVKMESREHACKSLIKIPENSTNIKLLRKPDYEFYENCTGKVKKVLVIFDSVDRSLCYEYSWYESISKFVCRGCCHKKLSYPNISKSNIRNEGTDKEFVIYCLNHQCEKRKYSPQKYAPIYEYVLKPDFEIQQYKRDGKEKENLIIFDRNDKNKCYQYYYDSNYKKFVCRGCTNNRKRVTATLNQNSEGDEYIILSNAKHVCEMRTSSDRIILHQPQDFEIIGETKKGSPRVFLFEKTDRKSGYIFYLDGNLHSCLGCNLIKNKRKKKTSNGLRRNAIGKLLKDEETGKYSFEMKPNQTHSCQPRPYQPEKYEDIPKTYDFFYYRLKNGPQTVKLAIQSPEDHQLCYSFVYHKSNKNFECILCQRMKKRYTIKPQKDAEGKEYFEHDLKKHICKPIKISSIPKSDILEESEIAFESKLKRTIKFDENKIIKSPNFELRPNRNGVPEKKLIIFYPNDQTLCYELFFFGRDQVFLCLNCKRKKSQSSAKLHKNDGEESFIVMGKKEHVCEPVKYRPF